jgi:hypothetical protein
MPSVGGNLFARHNFSEPRRDFVDTLYFYLRPTTMKMKLKKFSVKACGEYTTNAFHKMLLLTVD